MVIIKLNNYLLFINKLRLILLDNYFVSFNVKKLLYLDINMFFYIIEVNESRSWNADCPIEDINPPYHTIFKPRICHCLPTNRSSTAQDISYIYIYIYKSSLTHKYVYCHTACLKLYS